MIQIIDSILNLDIANINKIEDLTAALEGLSGYFHKHTVTGSDSLKKAEFILYELCKLPYEKKDYETLLTNLSLLRDKVTLYYNTTEAGVALMRCLDPLLGVIEGSMVVAGKEHIIKDLACYRVISILTELRKLPLPTEEIETQCLDLQKLFNELYSQFDFSNVTQVLAKHINDPKNTNQLDAFQKLSLIELEQIQTALTQFSVNHNNDITQLLKTLVNNKLQDPNLVKKAINSTITDILYVILNPEDIHEKSINEHIASLQNFLNKYPDVSLEDIATYFVTNPTLQSFEKLTNLETIEDNLTHLNIPKDYKNLLITVIDRKKKHPDIIKKAVIDLFRQIHDCKLRPRDKVEIKIKLDSVVHLFQGKFPDVIPAEMVYEMGEQIKNLYLVNLPDITKENYLKTSLTYLNKMFNKISKIDASLINHSAHKSPIIQILNSSRATLIIDLIQKNHDACRRELEAVFDDEKPAGFYGSISDFIDQINEQYHVGNLFISTMLISPKLKSTITNYKAVQRISFVLQSCEDPITKLIAVKNAYNSPRTKHDLKSCSDMSVVNFFRKIGYYLSSFFSDNLAQNFLTPQKKFNINTDKILKSALEEGVFRVRGAGSN